MPFLQPQDRQALERRFRDLSRDVTLTLFTVRSAGLLTVPGRECPTCPQAQGLLEEVVSLSPRLHLEVHDFYQEPEEARARGVERVPCILFSTDGKRSNMKFYGLPAGHEFITLIDTLTALSRGESPLSPRARQALGALDRDVHIQVFVTPT